MVDFSKVQIPDEPPRSAPSAIDFSSVELSDDVNELLKSEGEAKNKRNHG